MRLFQLASIALVPLALSGEPRAESRLDTGWRSIVFDEYSPDDSSPLAHMELDDSSWKVVDLPHNWDRYEGFRQKRHGNRHGTAWYRRHFQVPEHNPSGQRRVFLYFEGVGSYATVWVNGVLIGKHSGGLTTFTLDVTDAVQSDGDNTLVVRADHPASIRDLPWVCGGCEQAYGFSEGSQPFGIHRPVHLVTTDSLRIEPFGVHAWNDSDASNTDATIHVRTEVKNYGAVARAFVLTTRLLDHSGAEQARTSSSHALAAGASGVFPHDLASLRNAHLWSPDAPHLYRIVSELSPIAGEDASSAFDSVETPFGIRTVRWPALDGPTDQPLLLNGEPFFIHGTCDYEHNLGASHAFTDQQVHARVRQIQSAGFNAFRDAHHPHNLRFQQYWDRDGMLWWTQMGAHIWFDRDDFRTRYKQLLREWVRERRNSPSLVLWGLQNESKLPPDFAAECVALIRELDPTASTQRLITTCNGGGGTDWDVPQNWTGTYGGDPLAYGDELRRQRLVGEYGAWRSLGHHVEASPAPESPQQYMLEALAGDPLSEEYMTALLEAKVQLAESARDKVIGHFMWPFTTHANPGRQFGANGEQLRDGIRELDHIGPANNKGLFTIWGEPVDAYYMYRAHGTSAAKHPMVYIVSHSWPDRWLTPGRKSGIVVYSNAEEVELFNDIGHASLGTHKRVGRSPRFQWDDAVIDYNILHAVARVGGRVVATDCIRLHHLPAAPHLAALETSTERMTAAASGREYLHRVNCGGPQYTDTFGQSWSADLPSTIVDKSADSSGISSDSWASAYPHLPPAFGSQRRIYTPVYGTADDPLFQTFRYGRDELSYRFGVPEGDYLVELFFVEPWYGTGGGLDATGWRVFDVAVNGERLLQELDIWSEAAGHSKAVKKSVTAQSRHGIIEVTFPRVTAGQAVISAIAISRQTPKTAPTPQAGFPVTSARHDGRLPFITRLRVSDAENASQYSIRSHLDNGDRIYGDDTTTFARVPHDLQNAFWIQTATASAGFQGKELLSFELSNAADVFLVCDATSNDLFLGGWEQTGLRVARSGPKGGMSTVLRRRCGKGATVVLPPVEAETAMFSVLIRPLRPLAPPAAIRNLRVSAAPDWTAAGGLKQGTALRASGSPTVTRLPATLSDADWIRTEDPTGDVNATFEVSDHAEVYIGLDPRAATRPSWLSGWIESDLSIETSAGAFKESRLLKRRFPPGARVDLGPPGLLADHGPAQIYCVIVRSVRPSHTYVPASPSTPIWIIEVGVGDRYGINLRYRNETGGAIPAALAILASDGSTVCSRDVELQPTGAQVWSVLRTRTCANINAGTYTIRLDGPGLTRVRFDTMEIE